MIKKLKLVFKKLLGLPVVYNEGFFDEAWFQNWEGLKGILSQLIESRCDWKRILDFGCGPGIMIDWMNDKGFDYQGVDAMDEPKALYQQHFGRYPEKYLSRLPQDEAYDLCLSFDVFEHMKDEEIAELIQGLPKVKCWLINISREKSIDGHINIKTDQAWVSMIETLGLKFDSDTTISLRELYLELKPDASELWHKNLFVFTRAIP